ncbi:inverted formin-2-like [Liolophura sinensis]|uniref:inverted formin-2-like n=1 Tax=Liolophura sinensis TaxID=3198878 RepID=UPI0031589F81
MTTHTGLDYIIENKEFTDKFATALDKSNVASKKQVFELLSAMCVYSNQGYARALEALEHYKTTKKLRYRFGVILDELNKEESISYRAALLGFINCLIIYSKDIEDRVRIRNEFIGLKLLEVLNRLR